MKELLVFISQSRFIANFSEKFELRQSQGIRNTSLSNFFNPCQCMDLAFLDDNEVTIMIIINLHISYFRSGQKKRIGNFIFKRVSDELILWNSARFLWDCKHFFPLSCTLDVQCVPISEYSILKWWICTDIQIPNRSTKKPLNAVDFPVVIPPDPSSNLCWGSSGLKRPQYKILRNYDLKC